LCIFFLGLGARALSRSQRAFWAALSGTWDLCLLLPPTLKPEYVCLRAELIACLQILLPAPEAGISHLLSPKELPSHYLLPAK
jgi:hypothetical protein